MSLAKSFATHRPTDHDLANAITVGERLLRNPAEGVCHSNGFARIGFQPIYPTTLTRLWPMPTTFGDGIEDVVVCRSEEEVGGIHARRVVASVEDMPSGWNGTVEQLVGEPMGEPRVLRRIGEPSISARLAVPLPTPTFGSDLDLRPESLEKGSPPRSALASHTVILVEKGGGRHI